MTKPLRAAIEIIFENIDRCNDILEIGSRQTTNQNRMANLRNLFPDSKYVGLDMQAGPGVDIVGSGNHLPFPDETFDLVLCLETLEHADKPWSVATEIQRVLKPKGIAVVSSQQNFPIHKHPSDYFRYTPYGLRSLFADLPDKLVFAISPPFDDEVKLNPQHVVLVAIKGKNKPVLEKIKRLLRENSRRISVHKPYSHRVKDMWKMIKRALKEMVFRQEIKFFK